VPGVPSWENELEGDFSVPADVVEIVRQMVVADEVNCKQTHEITLLL
jgi:hypothetical protein